jgi:hypothetical protein
VLYVQFCTFPCCTFACWVRKLVGTNGIGALDGMVLVSLDWSRIFLLCFACLLPHRIQMQIHLPGAHDLLCYEAEKKARKTHNSNSNDTADAPSQSCKLKGRAHYRIIEPSSVNNELCQATHLVNLNRASLSQQYQISVSHKFHCHSSATPTHD